MKKNMLYLFVIILAIVVIYLVFNVYINTAFVTWKWDGLDEPIIARMSFILRNNCIYQLHSSALVRSK